MKNRNVLIIAKVMLPYTDSFGGCQRMYYLANYLCERGHNVTIVSEKKGKVNRNFKGLEIKYEMCWVESKVYENMLGLNAEIMKNLSKKIFNDINESFAFQHYIWCWESKKEIFNVIRRKKINTVIISAPFFSVFSLGNKIKKKFKNVNVILDYRDPWTLWNGERGLARMLESFYINKCDKVVCFCDELKKDMSEIFQGRNDKFEVIYNGYHEKAWKQIDTKKSVNSRMILEFVGNLSFIDSKENCRNPHILIKAFFNICKERSIELRFIGITNMTNDMKTIERKSEGKITFYKAVSAQESLKKMVEGDVLITINDMKNQADRYALSGKIFDYLRSDRVIWGIGAERGALHRFIEKNGVGVFCENKEKDIEKMLIELYEEWKKGCLIERKSKNIDWSIYSREKQNERYDQIICEL